MLASIADPPLDDPPLASEPHYDIRNPQPALRNPQSAIPNPQSAIANPQSAIANPQSAIRNPQSGVSSPAVAYIAFDLLRDGENDLRDRPFIQRRTALERVL